MLLQFCAVESWCTERKSAAPPIGALTKQQAASSSTHVLVALTEHRLFEQLIIFFC